MRAELAKQEAGRRPLISKIAPERNRSHGSRGSRFSCGIIRPGELFLTRDLITRPYYPSLQRGFRNEDEWPVLKDPVEGHSRRRFGRRALADGGLRSRIRIVDVLALALACALLLLTFETSRPPRAAYARRRDAARRPSSCHAGASLVVVVRRDTSSHDKKTLLPWGPAKKKEIIGESNGRRMSSYLIGRLVRPREDARTEKRAHASESVILVRETCQGCCNFIARARVQTAGGAKLIVSLDDYYFIYREYVMMPDISWTLSCIVHLSR